MNEPNQMHVCVHPYVDVNLQLFRRVQQGQFSPVIHIDRRKETDKSIKQESHHTLSKISI